MSQKAADFLSFVKNNKAEWVELRFCDAGGKEQHVSFPAAIVDEEFATSGRMFDGSSIAGWKSIDDSDMQLIPDLTEGTYVMDPFTDQPTVLLRCDIFDPSKGEPYNRDPRGIAKRAEAALLESGIADIANFGPEAEFFVFDDVRWKNDISGSSYSIDSYEAAWASADEFEDGNLGHRPGIKGGYFPVAPVDSLGELRNEICNNLQAIGQVVELHHHEVGTAGQCEIGTLFNSAVSKADEVLLYKYCVLRTADAWGKTATFMPKPLVGDNGSGMHVHLSLSKDGQNMFADPDGYGGLSQIALYAIGGIIKHGRAVNAFANATINSYRRLVPGYEAPVYLAYSARNRSASIRIPHTPNPLARRIEARFPDAAGNPYLTFAALQMAAMDGIINKIDPGKPADIDLYTASAKELQGTPRVAEELERALEALDSDREFMKAFGVMDDDAIDGYIALKMTEVERVRMTTTPAEFAMYYSC